MGKVRAETPVALVCAVCFRDVEDSVRAEASLTSKLGPISHAQEPYLFDHTDYYTREMGPRLLKRLVAFEGLIPAGELPGIKLATNEMESDLSEGGRRRVNLDPGYLAPARLVLASTKDFAHRIALGRGIYGEVTLLYQKGAFVPLPWTYPDYREPFTLAFLGRVRSWYLGWLEGHPDRSATWRT